MKEENLMIKREAEARGGLAAEASSSSSLPPPPPQVQTIVKKETPPEVLAELESYKVTMMIIFRSRRNFFPKMISYK